MNQLEVKYFDNIELSAKVRVVLIDGVEWFSGRDLVQSLGYEVNQTTSYTKYLHLYVDEDDLRLLNNSDLELLGFIDAGRKGEYLVNESGMYSLVIQSKIPQAKKIKKWVTSEVLPSIRRTGNYISDKERLQLQLFSDDKLVVVNAHKELIEIEKAPLIAKIEEQAPDVAFAKAIGKSSTLISVAELSNLISQNGVEMGRNRLFEWLRANGYLVKQKGPRRNLPTQRAIDLGILKMIEDPARDYHGNPVINKMTMVTPKGQQYFLNKFLLEEKKGA